MNIAFSPLAWAKYQALSRAHPFEVSALGLIDPEDPFHIVDIYVVEQEGSAGSTRMSPTALAQLTLTLFEQGIDLRRVRAWLHTHSRNKVFWSGTDTTTIEAMGGSVGIDDPDYLLLSVVTNDAGDLLGRVDQWRPVRHHWDAVPVVVRHVYPDVAAWLTEAKKLVTEEKIFPPKGAHPAVTTGASPFSAMAETLGAAAEQFTELSAKWGDGEDTCVDCGDALHFGDALRCWDCEKVAALATELEWTCPVCRQDFFCEEAELTACPLCDAQLEFA